MNDFERLFQTCLNGEFRVELGPHFGGMKGYYCIVEDARMMRKVHLDGDRPYYTWESIGHGFTPLEALKEAIALSLGTLEESRTKTSDYNDY